MKRFSSITRQNCARWVFILGVLVGLFFSGGEGIQLFPFPVAEDHSSKINVSDLETNPKSYAFSVFSSRNYSTLLKNKFQKHSNQYLSGESWLFDCSNPCRNFCLPTEKSHQETNISPNSLVLSSQSDRAPPTV